MRRPVTSTERGHTPAEHRQRGQALVETLLAAAALMPLLLGFALVAKYQDISRAAVQAARDLIFECALEPGSCERRGASSAASSAGARALAARHFGAASAPVVSIADAAAAPPDAFGRDPFWNDRGGRPLLARFDDVAVATASLQFDAPGAWLAGGAGRVFGDVLGTIAQAGPERFGLQVGEGLWRGRVELALAAPRLADGRPDPLQPRPLRMRVDAAVLADAWTASGPYGPREDSVESRVDRGWRLPAVDAALSAAYLPVRGLLAAAGLLRIEPAAEQFRFHEFDVDLVPADRIAGVRQPGPEARR